MQQMIFAHAARAVRLAPVAIMILGVVVDLEFHRASPSMKKRASRQAETSTATERPVFSPNRCQAVIA
ncbi:hypothetical protein [Pelagerythrobacter rhizovicinus]|uniref:Uncharacterized protein n=1 Tax=Pelagerythrobacter rhizovicinus TaxID=2268576 RepID=A0A4Q2KLA2_9SPHN|nr:hypothetical protein [Pelagerythrobacter rhizovicinus]RXZ66104.1 hypothetical protein ETX26_05175 [Pelagerythrobacter rhizovicinus]